VGPAASIKKKKKSLALTQIREQRADHLVDPTLLVAGGVAQNLKLGLDTVQLGLQTKNAACSQQISGADFSRFS
jgi:hypothetical protein